MGKLVKLVQEPRSARKRPKGPDGPPREPKVGELLFFTGVRYSRQITDVNNLAEKQSKSVLKNKTTNPLTVSNPAHSELISKVIPE